MREKQDGLTLLAYALIGAGALIYGVGVLATLVAGIVIAGPLSLLAISVLGLPVIGVGILLIKVIRDRMNDPEDRHYSNDIHD
ncbi:hypothetical protein [Euryhalocaulis caribicus]|uniref:hypothetical protein n=1 Tax=Euryhalocaulis caribicus TaxID=1161401 RepID=UPI00039A9F58|nr:hypothetical protein [Euryhalocaulis caribicus]